jgi:hypothetical protein
MRPTLAVTTALLLLLGTGVADAADPARLVETAGFLPGNAHRCGVPGDRVEDAGKVIHRFLRSERGSCCQLALRRDFSGERLSRPRRRRVDPALQGGDRAIRAA